MAAENIYDKKSLVYDEDFSHLKKNRDPIIKWTLFFFASIATIFVFLIIIFLFIEGAPFFGAVPLNEFLFGTNWLPSNGDYGALPIIVDTLLVVMGAIIIALPLGLATAIFIAEIAPPKLRKILKFCVEILAGIPSIVYGFFGLIVLNVLIKDIFGLHHGNTWLSGSLILAIMALPTIVSVCEDAIRAVPNYYREASYAMGATRWQTIYRVVIPSGMSGITAAIILGVGRALGETMAMLLVIGNCKVFPEPITNMLDCVAVITSTIAAGWGPTEQGSLEQKSYLALAILLFLMTLIINTLANLILSKIQRKFSGEKPKERFSKFKELIFYERFQNYKRLISTVLISGLILLIPIDFISRVIGVSICVVLSIILYIREKTPQNYKKLITYAVILSFIGWILSTWIGIFLAISICILFIGALIIIRKISTVAQQKLWFSMIYLCSFFVVFAVGILIFYIVVKGFPVLLEHDFLMGYPSHNGREGGIFPAIVGTLQLTLGSILFALPLGVCAGIYLSEYAKNNRITRFIRANIDNLNGTPSIVFALFGFVFFILFFGFGRSLLVGILTLGLMILPTIIRTTEEAVKAIPQSFREGSLALGSSKWKSISKIVLPAAIPGIVTGAVLSMGRSAGETAPIMFTAVRSSARWITVSLFEPVMALTYHLYRLNTEVVGAVDKAAGTALTLLILVLILYGLAFIVRSKYEKRKQW